jgi:hypothetical protein
MFSSKRSCHSIGSDVISDIVSSLKLYIRRDTGEKKIVSHIFLWQNFLSHICDMWIFVTRHPLLRWVNLKKKTEGTIFKLRDINNFFLLLKYFIHFIITAHLSLKRITSPPNSCSSQLKKISFFQCILLIYYNNMFVSF